MVIHTEYWVCTDLFTHVIQRDERFRFVIQQGGLFCSQEVKQGKLPAAFIGAMSSPSTALRRRLPEDTRDFAAAFVKRVVRTRARAQIFF